MKLSNGSLVGVSDARTAQGINPRERSASIALRCGGPLTYLTSMCDSVDKHEAQCFLGLHKVLQNVVYSVSKHGI